MSRLEHDEIIFLAPVIHSKLAKKFISTLKTSTTPSVLDCEVWRSPSGPVSVTNFTDGADGQDLYILGNGNLTLVHGTSIKTSTGANKVLAANKIYHVKLIDNVWYEVTT